MTSQQRQQLIEYFRKEQDVVLAFWYGSSAKKNETTESDIDIAVYLKNVKKEEKIWQKISTFFEKEVDLIVMNSAPATLVSNIFKTGIPLVIKKKALFLKLYLEKSLEAEDFFEFAKDYRAIYERSRSLSPEDKVRLLERVQFLEGELEELDRMRAVDFNIYKNDKSIRREMERWSENIINATIDIAKIVLASERKSFPKTYEEALRAFALLAGMCQEESERFSVFARLRNMLAHEYLDILYDNIGEFMKNFLGFYEKISPFLKKYMQ